MRRNLAALALGLAVAVSVLAVSGPVSAAPAPLSASDPLSASALQFPAGEVRVETAPAPDAAPTATANTESSPSATPSDPANAGTGEPAEEEATRTNFAPYVIGGIALLVALAVFMVRRRRRGKTTP